MFLISIFTVGSASGTGARPDGELVMLNRKRGDLCLFAFSVEG